MIATLSTALDQRLLVLTPTTRDAGITSSVLGSAGVPTFLCRSFSELLEELDGGAAALLVAEEVATSKSGALADVLAHQPRWSDLPVLVLTRPGADSPETAEALRTLGNVTLLERPLRVATLVSAVKTAVRARERQYQIRGYLAEQERVEQRLRSADRRKDEFLATLGHELRNPLASIMAAVELLRLTNMTDPSALKASSVVERQVNHLVRLVDDLLEVSRITRGIIDVRKDVVDLNEILKAAVDTSRAVIDASEHRLVVDVPDVPMRVSGDPIRLAQVFANLLNNAAKYTNTGGTVTLAARRERSTAVVSVRDDGIGIEPALLSSVFDMFMQVDRSARRTQGGLGIGLTLVRSLVTMHGGTVYARSEGSGRGSEFVVRLPLVSAETVENQEAAFLKPLPPRKILVVDDNEDAAESLGALLTALGAKVKTAHDGREALSAVDDFTPDVVLLDIGMPGMDGYEVSRRIRTKFSHEQVTLIALTGWGQEEDRRRSRAAGFDHHLVKPPDLEKLRELLA